MASSRYITRCLLGAHSFFLCLSLCSMATAQPSIPIGDVQGGVQSAGLDNALFDLSSSTETGTNAFQTFVKRVQLVVAGLVHVSVLVLPRLADWSNTHQGTAATNCDSGKQKRGNSAINTKTDSASASREKSLSDGPHSSLRNNNGQTDDNFPSCRPGSGFPSPGFPADGSHVPHWISVNNVLERSASSGFDWTNSCVFNLSASRGPRVEPDPPYRISATAAYHAILEKKEALVCSDYDTTQTGGPHYADWAELHVSVGARSMAAAPIYTADNQLIGVLTVASSEPHALDSSRVVWMLAMALAPLAASLQYASHALHVDAFIARIMPVLLDKNYEHNVAIGKWNGSSTTRAFVRQNHDPLKKGGGDINAFRSRNGAPTSKKSGGSKLSVHDHKPSKPSINRECFGVARHRPATVAKTTEEMCDRASSSRSLPGSIASAPPSPSPPLRHGGSIAMVPSSNVSPSPPTSAAAAAAATMTRVSGNVVHGSNATEAARVLHESPSDDAGSSSFSDADLDWGDFFFDLVSMGIVYAFFSDAVAEGESRVAVGVSMGIAGIDIALLALRWLCIEHRISIGEPVLKVFHLYRVFVLPIANMWMTWSLMMKVGLRVGGAAITLMLGGLVCLLLAGLKVRFLLHAPMQMASVLFAASCVPEVCVWAFDVPTGGRCLGVMSLIQLVLGVGVPSLMMHVVNHLKSEKRSSAGKQAKYHATW